MNTRTLPMLLAAAAALATAAPGQWTAYHGVSGTTHQARYNSLTPAGYRITSLSIYGSTGSGRRYAAVWRKQTGPAWAAFHGMAISSFQSYYDSLTGRGYQPTILTIAGSGSSATVAGVFAKDGLPTATRFGLTAQGFHAMCEWAQGAGYRLTNGAIYGTVSAPRFAGIWKKDGAKLDWGYSIGDDATQHQARYSAFASYGVRAHFVTVSNFQRYLAIWHDDRWASQATRHGQTGAQYQASFDSYAKAGYWPLRVHGGGSGSSTRYASIFVKGTAPLARQFTTTGTHVPALLQLDNYVRLLMSTNGVRAAQLAVVKDRKLVHARGYTYAESGYPVTQPTSLFRVASMTKPITSIGCGSAIEQTRSRGHLHGGASGCVKLVHGLVPPVAEREGAQAEDVFGGRGLPA